MNWLGLWHLGTRYLKRKRAKTALLIAAFTLVWLLPALVWVAVHSAREHVASRSVSTPLLVGRSGSPLELAFNGLYFQKPEVPQFPISEIADDSLGQVIPLHVRFSAQEYRIVGTSIDYARFRKHRFDQGRNFIRLGECVVGASVAAAEGVTVGDQIISSPESLFDLAGVYPLKMTVCGVMGKMGTADDRAIFVDLKTAWVIQGIGHGHQDAQKVDDDGRIHDTDAAGNEVEEGTIKLNASVPNYNEITSDNIDSFHFHAGDDELPVSSAIYIPDDAKAQALLKGRFAARDDLQMIAPKEEMDDLFATVFSVQKVVTGVLLLIGVATLAIGWLVFSLSRRLRIAEFSHLSNMGADLAMMRWLIGFEAIFVLGVSLLLASGLVGLAWMVAPMVMRQVLG
ncbi:MAG: ABC transporter permease [Verrucomicrobiota bacterium]